MERQEERDRNGVISIKVAVIGHLRPSLYTHSVLPSPPDFPTACVCVCVCVCVKIDSVHVGSGGKLWKSKNQPCSSFPIILHYNGNN